MSRRRVLLSILALYSLLALFLSLLAVKPAFYGLSTVLGTTILGTTVLGTTMLGTTVLSSALFGTTTTSLIEAYADALAMGQMVISLVAIGLLLYLELSDPSLGKIRAVFRELRSSWLPVAALLVLLFAIVVAFRIWAIIG